MLEVLVMAWGETTHRIVPWRHGCSHQSRYQCMGCFTLPRGGGGGGVVATGVNYGVASPLS